MKRDIWARRQIHGHPAGVRLPCAKGTRDTRPFIVMSPPFVLGAVCVAVNEVKKVMPIAHRPEPGIIR